MDVLDAMDCRGATVRNFSLSPPARLASNLLPHEIHVDQVLNWWSSRGWSDSIRSIGAKQLDAEFLERIGVPLHLRFVLDRLSAQREAPADALDSIPFYSLCRGLLLPLTGIRPRMALELFGIRGSAPPPARQRERLLAEFLAKPIGLTLEEKLGCLACDPFFGRASTFRQDRLLRLLLSCQLVGRSRLLDRLAQVGDVAVLFAESRPAASCELQLTAAEVLRTLKFLPDQPLNVKRDVLQSILSRCGKLEAYFLAKLLLGKNGAGLGVQLQTMTRLLAEHCQAPVELVNRAAALTDIFHVARALSEAGDAGLRKIRLQPMSAVRPALSGGTVEQIRRFPVWVERKYDGVRFLLHKSTDARGAARSAAFTRNGNDWLELVPGLAASIKTLPASSLILDGELYGMVLEEQGARPASVYEVVAALKGGSPPVSLRFVAFDLLFLNGADLTRTPLRDRQLTLANLFAATVGAPLPVAMSMAEGQTAQNMADVNRLYHHFRAQGYEGVITKDREAPYAIAARDPNWLKRKPEITLDLTILGATYAVNQRHPGLFGSYVMGARQADGQFVDIGDVDAVDRIKDQEIQQLILRDGLVTGRRIERKLTQGTRAGIEMRPSIVVTVVFQEITRGSDGQFMLRHPRIKLIRADKPAEEVDGLATISDLYYRQRVG